MVVLINNFLNIELPIHPDPSGLALPLSYPGMVVLINNFLNIELPIHPDPSGLALLTERTETRL
jgi:hypothetical protein